MLRTNLAKRTLVAALALCSIPLVSFAGVETLSPYMSTTFDSSGDYIFTNIQPFDTSLGTLIGVEFTLTLDEKADLSVTNLGTSSAKFSDATADFKQTKITLDIPTTSGTTTLVTKDSALDIGPESGSVGGGDTKTYKDKDSNSNTTVIFDPTSMYSSGTYSLDAAFKEFAADITGTTKSKDIYFGGSEDLVACLEVQYIYSDCCCSVPEPSTWALMGLSLAGLCFLRRKRAKVS